MSKPPEKPKNGSDLTQEQFAALQSEWYKKLAQTGFKDLEWVDPKTGYGQNSPHLRNPLNYVRRKYSKGVEEHYRKCRTFLAHETWGEDTESQMIKRLFEWYTEGYTYDEMSKAIKELRKTETGRALFRQDYLRDWAHKKLAPTLEYMEFWHYMSDHGLDNPANEEFYIEDIPIRPCDSAEE